MTLAYFGAVLVMVWHRYFTTTFFLVVALWAGISVDFNWVPGKKRVYSSFFLILFFLYLLSDYAVFVSWSLFSDWMGGLYQPALPLTRLGIPI